MYDIKLQPKITAYRILKQWEDAPAWMIRELKSQHFNCIAITIIHQPEMPQLVAPVCVPVLIILFVCILKGPSSPPGSLQKPSLRLPSGWVTWTAASIPSSTRAPARSSRRPSTACSVGAAWEPGRRLFSARDTCTPSPRLRPSHRAPPPPSRAETVGLCARCVAAEQFPAPPSPAPMRFRERLCWSPGVSRQVKQRCRRTPAVTDQPRFYGFPLALQEKPSDCQKGEKNIFLCTALPGGDEHGHLWCIFALLSDWEFTASW